MRISIVAALAVLLMPGSAAAVTCNAQPESPSCAKGDRCSGTSATAREGQNFMSFDSRGTKFTMCEATQCSEGHIQFARSVGKVRFLTGKLRFTSSRSDSALDQVKPLAAMIDQESGVASIVWSGRTTMMVCTF